MITKPGVYAITHTATGRVYIGSTANISSRWSRHRQELRDGIHRNRHLQAAYDKYGKEAFTWNVIALVDRQHLVWLEQRAIDHYCATDPERGFNKAPRAGSTRGTTGRKRTEAELRQAVTTRRARHAQHQPGDRCPQGHIKDGSYVKKGTHGGLAIRCQECERETARDRAKARSTGPRTVNGTPPGSRCRKNHIKDGSRTKRHPNGGVYILCQECERERDTARYRAAHRPDPTPAPQDGAGAELEHAPTTE